MWWVSTPTTEGEPAGAIREAAALLLAGQGAPWPDGEDIAAAASRADLFQGVGSLIFALVGLIASDAGDRLEVVAPLLRTLCRVEPDVPDDVLATIGGALAACAFGVSPTAWRTRGQLQPDGVLPVPAIEAYAWGVTGRLLVDLYDSGAGAGAAAALLNEVLAEP